jgi:hypothetical protein
VRFEQADRPGLGITLRFATEEKAVGGSDIGTYQDGLAILEDLIQSGDRDRGKILAEVMGARRGDGLADDVVPLASKPIASRSQLLPSRTHNACPRPPFSSEVRERI